MLKGQKRPPPQDFQPKTKKTARFTLRANFVLTKDRKRLYYRHFFVVKYTGRGLVVKRPGVLSKVQMLNLVLGVGVFSLLPNMVCYYLAGAKKTKKKKLVLTLPRI